MTPPVGKPRTKKRSVALGEVDAELARQQAAAREGTGAPLVQARMSNLVIFCDDAGRGPEIRELIPSILAMHPARVLFLTAGAKPKPGGFRPSVFLHRLTLGGMQVCTEEITIPANDETVAHLPSAVRSLIIGDLPTNLWWHSRQPPPMAGPLLEKLSERTQQFIFDSAQWTEAAPAMAALPAWLDRFEVPAKEPGWRTASDLAWRRLKYWRRIVAQALDPALGGDIMPSIGQVELEHGPGAVVQAWALVGWLAAQFGWTMEKVLARNRDQVQWQVRAQEGRLTLTVRSLPKEPCELRRLRMGYSQAGRPHALTVMVEDERRLAVWPEDSGAAVRTITIQRQGLAELVGRQLSDREPDPIFRKSMTVAKTLAEGTLD
jgi:glucose-6-phosphate dehydrogenase assembly protein OpcA